MRFRLRTLLIVLTLMPPLLAAGYWGWIAWQRTENRTVCGPGLKQIGIALHNYHDLTVGGSVSTPAD